MEIWKFVPGRMPEAMRSDEPLGAEGFAWLHVPYDETDLLQREVERLTGVRIFDVHVSDAKNPSHPTFFDNTDAYEIVVFAGLSPESTADRIVTRTMTFFNFDRLLVTVSAPDSRSAALVRARYLNVPSKSPQSPDDLMQRLLSSMVDQYLELRQPLTERLEAWQRQLLDPRTPFHDWVKLLEARQQIRTLQSLSEEQRDAIQEWRDYRIADLSQAMQARFVDIIEHIERVLGHARTIENQAESAVQIYFAAMSHRTTEIMRLLTLLTAIFMPLTLITGLFGMNFDFIPGLHNIYGFWISITAMLGIVAGMIAYFRWKRWL